MSDHALGLLVMGSSILGGIFGAASVIYTIIQEVTNG